MRTDQELRKIAEDFRDGLIFTDRDCRDLEELRRSFLVIALMDGDQISKMKKDKVAFVFEYYDRAAPRSVNGNPIFSSCHTLNEDESKRMFAIYETIRPPAPAAP